MKTRIGVCVLNDTRVDRHHGCSRVMAALESLVVREGMEILATCPAHQDWRAHPGFLAALERARLVIVNGEGTLHHDRPEAHRLLEIGGYARSRGMPAILVNAGWEANGPELAQKARLFDLVAVRDRHSASALEAEGIQCTVMPDLSLYLPAPVLRHHEAGAIAFTDSVDRHKSVALDACRRQVGGETLAISYAENSVAGYFAYLRAGVAARDALQPAFLMQVVRIRHRLLRRASQDTERFLASLAASRFLVSGRFHACTLALLAGTPFMAIASNTGKIASLVADAGLESWRATTPLDKGAVLEAAERGWCAGERLAIEGYLGSARERADRFFREVRALA